MAPILDGTASHYGEPEADLVTRRTEWLLDNARLVFLLAILAAELVWLWVVLS